MEKHSYRYWNVVGLIMAYNVWFIIWPNQKKALGIVGGTPEEKPIAAKKALLIKSEHIIIITNVVNNGWLKIFIKVIFLLFLEFYNLPLSILRQEMLQR